MSTKAVRSLALLSQPVLSEGLVYGKCGMTDIDLSCDWQGRYFVFVELKWAGTPMPRGQQYHLEGLVKAIRAGGKEAIAIHASHQAVKGEPIMASGAMVTRVYKGKMWEKEPGDVCLQDYMGELHQRYMESRAK